MNCNYEYHYYPALSMLLLAKINYTEGYFEEAYTCLAKAILQEVKTFDVNIIFWNLFYKYI